MDAAGDTLDQSAAVQGTVLHVVTGLGVGGAERVVLNLANALSRYGWRLVIVSLNSDRRLLEQYASLPCDVHSLDIKHTPWSALKAIPVLIATLRRERPVVIHAHMFHGLLVSLLCRALLPQARLVFTSHNFAGFGWLRHHLIEFTRALRSADVIFAIGQHPGLNAKNTLVIPNGVIAIDDQPAPVPDRHRPYVFLFAGRLEAQKNPVALITAFNAMRHQDCVLWLAGEGPLRPQLEQRIAELNLTDRVQLLGLRNDLPALLRKADCFVMASHWEGLPMVILEAGAAGLPVIAPPVGAIPQLLEGGCGYLADPANLAQAMDAVLDAPEEARKRGRRLHDRIMAGYTVASMAEAHARLYMELLHRKAQGTRSASTYR